MNPARNRLPVACRTLLVAVALWHGSVGALDSAGVPAFPDLAVIPAGVHRPLFRTPDEPKEIPVAAFQLEISPVTQGQFLEFVRANPRWRRSNAKRLFADEGYLGDWSGDLDLGPDATARAARPVTRVSWFAAKAYASWKGRRLPTTSEWELASAAGFARADGAAEPEFRSAVRRWYGTPASEVLAPVRSGRANLHGVHDLHGLVWEWTSDFNSALVTGDARGDTGIERMLFCGAGSQGATDRGDFPAFMRSGLRSSLKASYVLPNLGFRCALDLPRPSVSSPSR
ncbi:MAG: formylglycine-generating enzyme family protein [Verrucomicrobia bacterium]|nr:MAG: formylglycine-generating enzyme family protein [Verrucomicrobiota bacterium]